MARRLIALIAVALVAAGCGEDAAFQLDDRAIESVLEQEFDGGLGVFETVVLLLYRMRRRKWMFKQLVVVAVAAEVANTHHC